MLTQTLQGALQQAIRNATGKTTQDFNGDLHSLCDLYGIPVAPISGRIIPVAKLFDASINSSSAALNYLLNNSSTVVGPIALFANGEQGAWYDPSDLTTLFQDSAGTTPVTAVAQPVGLMLDKSKGGRQSLPITGWVKDSGDGVVTVNGGTITITGATTTTRVDILAPGWVIGNLGDITINGTVSGAVSPFLFIGGSPFAIVAGTNTYRSLISGSNLCRVQVASGSATFDVTSRGYVPGNHAYQSTSTSRPVLQQDGNGKYYLAFDGTDDSLLTNSVDFTATDKMTVWAGVRKLSTSTGIFTELSADNAANNGSFLIGTDSGGIEYFFNSRGTANQQVNADNAAYTSPVTNVLQMSGNISGPSVSARINAVDISTNTGSQGTGNFGNYPLYIGRRNNTSFPFNGNLYSLIIRGAQSTASQISSTETWVNGKTEAY